jgi:hypothetical protein
LGSFHLAILSHSRRFFGSPLKNEIQNREWRPPLIDQEQV